MSLVICSNAQEGYSELVDGIDANRITGLQEPASFHNALSNTITLPPKSEVGVVSAKIFRKSDWDITRSMRFYVLFDELLLDGESLKSSSVTMPIPVDINPGYYSGESLQAELTRAMSSAFGTHPNLHYHGCKVLSAKDTFLPLVSTVAKGLSYQIQQTSRADLVAPAGASVVTDLPRVAGLTEFNMIQLGESLRDDLANVSYDVATRTLTRLRGSTVAIDDGGVVQFTDAPITMTGAVGKVIGDFGHGALSVDFTGQAGTSWAIGLSRPEVRTGNGSASTPGYFASDQWLGVGHTATDNVAILGNTLWDYAVAYNQTTEQLTVWHAIASGIAGDEGEITMAEVQYWTGGGTRPGAQYTKADLVTGGGNSSMVNISVWGEGVKIWLTDSAGNNHKIIVEGTTDASSVLGLSRCVKPVPQTAWALYPKIALSTFVSTMLLHKYEIPMPETQLNGMVGGYDFPASAPITGWPEGASQSGGSSFWGRAIFDETYRRLAYNVDCVRDRLTGWDPLTTQVAYTLMDGSVAVVGPPVVAVSEAINYDYAFILNPDERSPDTVKAYPNNGSGDCRRLLGFPATDIMGNIYSFEGEDYQGAISTSQAGDVNGTSNAMWRLNSSNANEPVAKQLFIKCSSLTHQSYNFCKGLPSKILWSVPRFSNDGQTVGPLFFQQDTPISSFMNNVNPLVINDLSLELVDKDEKVVKDLGGETVICLHFKKGHSCK
jgi:hypothetical protein